MDDRKFLEKIRRLQESGKRIELTEFPIEGKRTLIESRSKNILLENETQNLQASEQQEEESAFKDKVSQLVKFEPIKVHKENVEWQGNLIREKIQWNFSLDENVGCYIQSLNDNGELTPVQLTDDTIQTIRQLRVYYDVWSEEWASRLTGGKSEDETDTTTNTEGDEAATGTEGGGFGF